VSLLWARAVDETRVVELNHHQVGFVGSDEVACCPVCGTGHVVEYNYSQRQRCIHSQLETYIIETDFQMTIERTVIPIKERARPGGLTHSIRIEQSRWHAKHLYPGVLASAKRSTPVVSYKRTFFARYDSLHFGSNTRNQTTTENDLGQPFVPMSGANTPLRPTATTLLPKALYKDVLRNSTKGSTTTCTLYSIHHSPYSTYIEYNTSLHLYNL